MTTNVHNAASAVTNRSAGITVAVDIDDCAVRSVDAAKVAAAKDRSLASGDVERITDLFR